MATAGSSKSLGSAQKREFDCLRNEAKLLVKEGKLSQALGVLQKARSLCYSEKLEKQIDALESHILENGEELDDDSMTEVCKGFSIYSGTYDKLYPYQREAVAWLFNLYQKRKGGVIGDDMGLGKTIQIIAFLSGMFDSDRIKSVMIVMPVSLIPNWEKEFETWAGGIEVYTYRGNIREREKNLYKVQKKGGVLLTSYGIIVTSSDELSTYRGRTYVWDYIILDEGHKIKNPTKTTKAMHEIPSRNRIVLTGTPIQNNLDELWSLYDYVHQGGLLGSRTTFKMQYATPITKAREKDATAGERRLGLQISESLRDLIAPYFLRRTKAEVLQHKANEKENADPNYQAARKRLLDKFAFLSKKDDFIVWGILSSTQIQIYEDFLELDHVKNLLMTTRSPLVELTVLKKICDHPRLLSKKACLQLGLSEQLSNLEELIDDDNAELMSIEDIPDEVLIDESGKLEFLIRLLENLRSNNHRTLVFSQSRKMLDIIHRILSNRNWNIMRLDGTITKLEERQRRIDTFQNDDSISVFLLTTQVGGVGLTLTAADRAVIYDPSWNPATDAQAVDRVYRIGQQKRVVVYRLVTCGTVEEKIYRRQVFKDSIIKQTTGQNKDPFRYFTRQELRDLFTLDNPGVSNTQIQLETMHGTKHRTDPEIIAHVQFLNSLKIFGLSDHDLVFSKDDFDEDLDHDDGVAGEQFIRDRVRIAQLQLQQEANRALEENERLGNFARGFQLPVITKKKTDSPGPASSKDKLEFLDVAEEKDFLHSKEQIESLEISDDSGDDDDDGQKYKHEPVLILSSDETNDSKSTAMNAINAASADSKYDPKMSPSLHMGIDENQNSETHVTDESANHPRYQQPLKTASLDKSLAVMKIKDSSIYESESSVKEKFPLARETDFYNPQCEIYANTSNESKNSMNTESLVEQPTRIITDSYAENDGIDAEKVKSHITACSTPQKNLNQSDGTSTTNPLMKRITPLSMMSSQHTSTSETPFQKAIAHSLELSPIPNDTVHSNRPVLWTARKLKDTITLDRDKKASDAANQLSKVRSFQEDASTSVQHSVLSSLDGSVVVTPLRRAKRIILSDSEETNESADDSMDKHSSSSDEPTDSPTSYDVNTSGEKAHTGAETLSDAENSMDKSIQF